jgi:hypothetical protein
VQRRFFSGGIALSDIAQRAPEPPKPPEMKAEFKLYPYQMIGLPLLFLIPILALLGVFESSSGHVIGTGDGLQLSVEYMTRTMYHKNEEIHIEVANMSDAPLAQLSVRIDKSYLDGFGPSSFSPPVSRVTGEAYEIDMADVGPGESRAVVIQVQGDQYGSNRGAVSALAADGRQVSIQLETYVFP